MKKFIFSTCIGALLALTGCQESDELVNDYTGKPITVTANIQGSPESRVVLTPDADENQNPIVRVEWKEDSTQPETFKIYGSDFNGEDFTQTSGNQFTGNTPAGGSPYLAVYGNHGVNNKKITYDFTQQDGALNDDDFLMTAENITDLNQPIKFKHKTAILKVTFVLDEQDVDAYTTDFTMTGVNTGVQGNNTITVKNEKSDDIYVFLPIEEPYKGGDQFTFTAKVANVGCTGTITIPQNMTVEAGKFYTANVTLNDADMVNCYLPTGSVFNTAVKGVIGERNDVTSIEFKTGVQGEEGGTRIGKTRAMAKVDNNKLIIYTVKSKFWFNPDCKSMFQGLTTITSINWGDSFSTDLVGDMSYMFKDCKKLSLNAFPDDFSVLGVASTKGMFENCNALTTLDLSNFAFGWYISDMSSMFKGCTKLTSISVEPEKFKTGTVLDMSSIFEDCSSLNSVISLDISNTAYMSSMFKGCTSLTAFNVTWNSSSNNHVIKMDSMFRGCTQLASVAFGENFHPTVKTMSYMFDGCTSLTGFNFSWSVFSTFLNMDYMFNGCINLQTFQAYWDGGTKLKTNYMFNGCEKLQTVAFYRTISRSEITNMSYMFNGCKKLSSADLRELYCSESTPCVNAFNNVGTEYAQNETKTQIYVYSEDLNTFSSLQDTGINDTYAVFNTGTPSNQ